MTSQADRKGVARRDFLKAAGIGAAAVAGTVAGAGAATKAEAAEKGDERKKSRYRETDHVKKFYASNRL